jgi:hypothetical protein
MSTALVGLLLLIGGVAVAGLLLVLLTRPLIGPAVAAVERARLAQRLARAARADAYLRAGDVRAALRELEQAFCLFTVRVDAGVAEQITAHHTGLLSRCLTVADAVPSERVRLLALAKVDRLLDRRREMQRALLQLRGRSARDARRLQLERELGRNATAVRQAVRELLADLELHRNRRATRH